MPSPVSGNVASTIAGLTLGGIMFAMPVALLLSIVNDPAVVAELATGGGVVAMLVAGVRVYRYDGGEV